MTGIAKPAAFDSGGRLTGERIRHTRPYRYTLLLRVVAGVPLLGIGLAHVFAPEAPMRPLVEAAGIPFAAVVAPVAVAIEVVAGLSLLLGLWARIGALLAVPTSSSVCGRTGRRTSRRSGSRSPWLCAPASSCGRAPDAGVPTTVTGADRWSADSSRVWDWPGSTSR